MAQMRSSTRVAVPPPNVPGAASHTPNPRLRVGRLGCTYSNDSALLPRWFPALCCRSTCTWRALVKKGRFIELVPYHLAEWRLRGSDFIRTPDCRAFAGGHRHRGNGPAPAQLHRKP